MKECKFKCGDIVVYPNNNEEIYKGLVDKPFTIKRCLYNKKEKKVTYGFYKTTTEIAEKALVLYKDYIKKESAERQP
jgi:hypothetical protein